jgi:hypothetical protein
VTKRRAKISKQDWGGDWVHELIDMTRPGAEIEFPPFLRDPVQPPRPL